MARHKNMCTSVRWVCMRAAGREHFPAFITFVSVYWWMCLCECICNRTQATLWTPCACLCLCRCRVDALAFMLFYVIPKSTGLTLRRSDFFSVMWMNWRIKCFCNCIWQRDGALSIEIKTDMITTVYDESTAKWQKEEEAKHSKKNWTTTTATTTWRKKKFVMDLEIIVDKRTINRWWFYCDMRFA